ncbi:hypothetical protein DSM3645_27206 [Blastopirellula marina DSM 3645]|uniref:Uncharacterized protein n=1 Tax=Blastopirellula marina DSM 3645 TaxID=314230 RepID=A4A020_9BACT|nr:hypothetical protein DSM3645_27206 [Blastopirellula marina DSM 3645]
MISFVGSFLAAIDFMSSLDRWIECRSEPILHGSLARIAGTLIGCAFGSLLATIACVVIVLGGLLSLDHVFPIIAASCLLCGATAGSFPEVGKRLSGITGFLYVMLMC